MMLCSVLYVSNVYLVSFPCTLFFEAAVNHTFLPYIRSWHKLCLVGLSIFVWSVDKFSVNEDLMMCQAISDSM